MVAPSSIISFTAICCISEDGKLPSTLFEAALVTNSYQLSESDIRAFGEKQLSSLPQELGV